MHSIQMIQLVSKGSRQASYGGAVYIKGEKMNSFKCPECEASEVESNLCLSTDWSVTGEVSSPQSYVLQQLLCRQCDEYIPSHLGERWDGLTYEEAKSDWLLKYKRK